MRLSFCCSSRRMTPVYSEEICRRRSEPAAEVLTVSLTSSDSNSSALLLNKGSVVLNVSGSDGPLPCGRRGFLASGLINKCDQRSSRKSLMCCIWVWNEETRWAKSCCRLRLKHLLGSYFFLLSELVSLFAAIKRWFFWPHRGERRSTLRVSGSARFPQTHKLS